MAIVNTIPASWRAALAAALRNAANRAFLALFAARERWGLWLPVPLAAGIALYFSLENEPAPWAALAVLGTALAALWVRRGTWGAIGWLCVATVALGFLAGVIRTQAIDTALLSRESGPVTVEGRVASVDALPKALRVTLEDVRLTGGWLKRGDAMPARIRVKLKNKDTADPAAGDTIRLRAVLLPLSAPVAPGAFDFQRHAFFQGLGATGYAIGDAQLLARAESGGDIFAAMRHAIRKRMAAGIADADIAAIVTAFLVGESKGISTAAWDDIRRSGIAHLLAISGFHITVVTGAFFVIVRALLAFWPWAALHWPIKKISAACAMAGSVFYLLLIGSPVTAERAVIMACVVMVAIMLDRDPFSLRLAAFAAAVLLVLRPEVLVGPSFQMSFAAVVALIAFYESVARRWVVAGRDTGWLRRLWLYMLACLLTTVIATLATAPFTTYHFGQVPLLAGLVSNMIAVPLSSLVTLPFGILACLLMPFGMEAAPLWVTEQSMIAIMAVVRVTAGWTHAVLAVDSFDVLWLVVFTLGGLWICIWQAWWRWLGSVAVVAACVGALWASPRADVLVAANGRQAAVRDDDGRIWLSHPRRERFATTAWLQREAARHGQQAAGSWEDATAAGIMRCDAKACLFEKGGVRIVLAAQPEAVVEDCALADVFIAPQARLSRTLCPGKAAMMVDERRLRDDGAYAVYVEDGVARLASVATTRGNNRPWVARYTPIPAAIPPEGKEAGTERKSR